MKKYCLWMIMAIGSAGLLAGCSESDDKTASTDSAQTAPATTSATTPPQTAAQDAGQLPSSGKVLKAIHAGGYTYMEVENNGKQLWIASNMLKVKRDDNVVWSDAALMKNFKSSSLHRTFDEILFVSSIQIK